MVYYQVYQEDLITALTGLIEHSLKLQVLVWLLVVLKWPKEQDSMNTYLVVDAARPRSSPAAAALAAITVASCRRASLSASMRDSNSCTDTCALLAVAGCKALFYQSRCTVSGIKVSKCMLTLAFKICRLCVCMLFSASTFCYQ